MGISRKMTQCEVKTVYFSCHQIVSYLLYPLVTMQQSNPSCICRPAFLWLLRNFYVASNQNKHVKEDIIININLTEIFIILDSAASLQYLKILPFAPRDNALGCLLSVLSNEIHFDE